MTVTIPEGFARVGIVMRHELDPVPWVVTYGVAVEGLSAADFDGTTERQHLVFADVWKEVLDNQIVIVESQVAFGTSGDPVLVTSASGAAGLRSGDSLPQNCALLVRKQTAVGGRRGKGRCFLPGVLADNVVNDVGVVTSDGVTAYNDICDEWFAQLHADTGAGATSMVLLHGTGTSSVLTPSPVTKLSIDSVISTQRRRLR